MNASTCEGRAQTNLQLYRQLLAAGYDVSEVTRVRDAYEFATKLFASQLRPEGRPFICHVVGVASLLVMFGARRTTAIAGLLHSAYSHGDFGQGRGRVTSGARDAVRAAVGPEVERMLSGYALHPLSGTTVSSWLEDGAGLSAEAREIVLIRLADVLEDSLDHGLQRSRKTFNANRDVPTADLVRLAGAIGYPLLGASLQAARDAPANAAELDAIRDRHAGSYVVCPSSWREKILPRVLRLIGRGQARR